jgi:hypothetical protein
MAAGIVQDLWRYRSIPGATPGMYTDAEGVVHLAFSALIRNNGLRDFDGVPSHQWVTIRESIPSLGSERIVSRTTFDRFRASTTRRYGFELLINTRMPGFRLRHHVYTVEISYDPANATDTNRNNDDCNRTNNTTTARIALGPD